MPQVSGYRLYTGAHVGYTATKARLDRQNRWLAVPFPSTLFWIIPFRARASHKTYKTSDPIHRPYPVGCTFIPDTRLLVADEVAKAIV